MAAAAAAVEKYPPLFWERAARPDSLLYARESSLATFPGKKDANWVAGGPLVPIRSDLNFFFFFFFFPPRGVGICPDDADEFIHLVRFSICSLSKEA